MYGRTSLIRMLWCGNFGGTQLKTPIIVTYLWPRNHSVNWRKMTTWEDCLKLCNCLLVEKEAVFLVRRKGCVTILILGNLSVERLEMEMLLELFYRWGGEPPLPRAMRILSWICQGLGNPWTGRSHRKLVREQAPMVCFLMETRLDTEGFNNL